MIVATILSRLSLPVIIALSVIVFYEGVPIVNDIPFVDRIPGIGDLAVGRVGRARREGGFQERLVWQERQRRAAVKRAAQRRVAQETIDALEREYFAAQSRLSVLELKQGITDADYLCDGPALSERLSGRVDRAGRD